MVSDGQGDRAASWLRQVINNTHALSPSLSGLFELEKVEHILWEPGKLRAGFPESPGSGKGQSCTHPTPQVRLVSRQSFALEELQLLGKALRAMQRERSSSVPGWGGQEFSNWKPHPRSREGLITDSKGGVPEEKAPPQLDLFELLTIHRELGATKRRKKNVNYPGS